LVALLSEGFEAIVGVPDPQGLARTVLNGGMLGAGCGTLFALALVAYGRVVAAKEVSGRFAAVSGALIAPIGLLGLMLGTGGWAVTDLSVDRLLLVGTICGGIGAVAGRSIVALAARAPDDAFLLKSRGTPRVDAHKHAALSE
jgi:hypothetical protein